MEKTQALQADKAVTQFVHIPILLTEPEEITLEEYEKVAENWGTRQTKGMGNSSKNQ